MKIFDFEQKMKKENGDFVNIIYKDSKEQLHITTLKGKSCLMEVAKGDRVVYDTLEILLKNSDQFSKHETLNSFLVDTSKSTDASKWEVSEILTIKKIKNILSITDDDIAEMFSYKNKLAYANSSAKTRIENGLVAFYTEIKKSEEKI